jgi:hypothetical protein
MLVKSINKKIKIHEIKNIFLYNLYNKTKFILKTIPRHCPRKNEKTRSPTIYVDTTRKW